MVQPYYEDDVSDDDMTDAESEDYEEPSKMVSTGYIRSDFTVLGAVTCLNRIRIGTMAWNRVGRSIKMATLIIRGQLGGGSNIFSDVLRLIVVYDRQPNGTTPLASDILKDYLQDGSTLSNSTSTLNMANRERFVVVTDIMNRGPQTTPTGVYAYDPHSRFCIDTCVPLANMRTQYKQDSVPASVADIATGSLWLLTMSKETPGTWGFYGTFTVEYTDV